MNYIINPSWFYWIKVVNYLYGAMIGLLLVSFVICVIFFGLYLSDKVSFYNSHASEREEYKPNKLVRSFNKIAILSLIIVIISTLGIIFMPTKNTLIEMQIAKMATYENAQWTVESLKSVVDYIVEAIQKVK